MKVVILCGGRGSRLNELTQDIPKPLIRIHGKPILWYICNHFKKYGHNDFVFLLGYKGGLIRKEFQKYKEFKITYVHTRVKASKTERLLAAENYVDDNFFLAYGDDICDVNLDALSRLFRKTDATIANTSVLQNCDFGKLEICDHGAVDLYIEKPRLPFWINGGYYLCKQKLFFLLKKYEDFEGIILPLLAKKGEFYSHKHYYFWKSCNTLKDVEELQNYDKRILER